MTIAEKLIGTIKQNTELRMRTVERELGKDVANLIGRKLHAIYTAELVAEYHYRVGTVRIWYKAGVEGCGICVGWPGKTARKHYNYRFEGDNRIQNMHFKEVARLPKHYRLK